MDECDKKSELRQRHVVLQASDEFHVLTAVEAEEGAEASTSSATWNSQLSEARKMVAARVRKQQEDDGWVNVEDELLGEEKEVSGTRDDTPPVGTKASSSLDRSRQGSVSSENDDEEAVKELLQPRKDETSYFNPTEEDKEFPHSAPGAFHVEPGAARTPPTAIPTTARAEIPTEEKICRICFDGEDEELGRLFSPCLCRGTSRFVHVVCLDRWRAASAGATSYYKCDQCGYEYKLGRTRIAGLTRNRMALFSLTAILFSLLVFLAGFIASYLIDIVEERSMRMSSPLEDLFVSDHVIMGEAVREAVSFFGSRVENVNWPGILNTGDMDDDENEADEVGWSGKFWQLLNNNDQKLTKSTGSSGSDNGRRNNNNNKRKPKGPSRLRRTVEHMIKGMSLIGLASFSAALISPFGLRGSLLRAFRPGGGRRQARGERADQPSFSQILLVMFVLVGVWKAVSTVYRGVQYVSKKALSRVENIVMDV